MKTKVLQKEHDWVLTSIGQEAQSVEACPSRRLIGP